MLNNVGVSLKKIYSNWNRRFYETIDKQVVQIKEKPQKVALGCSLGICINFFPTLGFGFIFAFLLAFLFRVNRASATATSLVTGPLVPFMYALNFLLGGLILAPAAGEKTLQEFIAEQYALILTLGGVQERLLVFLDLLGATFILGALINSAIFGTIFYFMAMAIMKKRMSSSYGGE